MSEYEKRHAELPEQALRQAIEPILRPVVEDYSAIEQLVMECALCLLYAKRVDKETRDSERRKNKAATEGFRKALDKLADNPGAKRQLEMNLFDEFGEQAWTLVDRLIAAAPKTYKSSKRDMRRYFLMQLSRKLRRRGIEVSLAKDNTQYRLIDAINLTLSLRMNTLSMLRECTADAKLPDLSEVITPDI